MGTNTVKKEISLYKGAEMTETEIKSMIDKDLYESNCKRFYMGKGQRTDELLLYR